MRWLVCLIACLSLNFSLIATEVPTIAPPKPEAEEVTSPSEETLAKETVLTPEQILAELKKNADTVHSTMQKLQDRFPLWQERIADFMNVGQDGAALKVRAEIVPKRYRSHYEDLYSVSLVNRSKVFNQSGRTFTFFDPFTGAIVEQFTFPFQPRMAPMEWGGPKSIKITLDKYSGELVKALEHLNSTVWPKRDEYSVNDAWKSFRDVHDFAYQALASVYYLIEYEKETYWYTNSLYDFHDDTRKKEFKELVHTLDLAAQWVIEYLKQIRLSTEFAKLSPNHPYDFIFESVFGRFLHYGETKKDEKGETIIDSKDKPVPLDILEVDPIEEEQYKRYLYAVLYHPDLEQPAEVQLAILEVKEAIRKALEEAEAETKAAAEAKKEAALPPAPAPAPAPAPEEAITPPAPKPELIETPEPEPEKAKLPPAPAPASEDTQTTDKAATDTLDKVTVDSTKDEKKKKKRKKKNRGKKKDA